MSTGRVEVVASAVIAARSEDVYAVVADYRVAHPAFLPPRNFHLEVEEGGYGADTVFRFVSRVMGVERTFHMQVSEPEPGRVLVERETDGPLATTWTFTPVDDGRRVQVTIRTETDAGAGLRGVVERLIVPRALRAVYREELGRLAAVVRERAGVAHR